MTSSTLRQLLYDQQGYHSASPMMSVCGDPATRASKSHAVAIQRSRDDAQSRQQLLEEMRQKEAAAEAESEEDTRPFKTKGVGGLSSGRFTNPKSEARVSFHPNQIDLPTTELYEDYGEIFQLDL
jgi:hypothetical protein